MTYQNNINNRRSYVAQNNGRILHMNDGDYLKAPDFVRINSQSGNPRSGDVRTPQNTVQREVSNSAHRQIPPKPLQSYQKAPTPAKKHGLLDMLNLNNIEMDSDRSILLMLIAVLSGRDNESDDLLIMALMYIML